MTTNPDSFLEHATALARQHGIAVCRDVDPRLLRPEERIRALCREDKCGNWRKHHMCPPLLGDLRRAHELLERYAHGVLLQWSRELDAKHDRAGVERSKVDFHRLILAVEEGLRARGFGGAFGLIGGSCGLCAPCTAARGEPCPLPHEARPSLEALGVDLLSLLARLGLDAAFHPDRITWTGCVLLPGGCSAADD